MLDDTLVLQQLGCFSKINGAGDVAILAAIYLSSKYANNPSFGIKIPAFSVGADTDTIASITAGLLGMLCGTVWIPAEWRIVQDYDWLIQITELLFSENQREASKLVVSRVKEKVPNWRNTPIELMYKPSTETVKSGENTIIVINKWRSALGQTIYFKEYKRIKNLSRQSDEQAQFSICQEKVLKRETAEPVQNSIASDKLIGQFVLLQKDLDRLLNEPLLKNRTFRKMNALLTRFESINKIAKQLKIDPEIVDIVKTYIK